MKPYGSEEHIQVSTLSEFSLKMTIENFNKTVKFNFCKEIRKDHTLFKYFDCITTFFSICNVRDQG